MVPLDSSGLGEYLIKSLILLRFAKFPDNHFFGKIGTHPLRAEFWTPMGNETPIFYDTIGYPSIQGFFLG